jgi:conjugative transfer signal peptidase TraF
VEVVRESASVVGQDKGNAVRHGAAPRFSRFPYDFSHRHSAVRTALHRVARTVRNRVLPAALFGRARRLILLATAALTSAALLGLAGALLHLRITLTDSSAPAGIYRLTATAAGRGALVAACLPAAIARTGLARGYLGSGGCPAGAEPVAKVVGALPGDVVEVEPGWAAVNGVRFTKSRTSARDSAGRPLAHMAWGIHRVGAGEVWLIGFNDARSWDARYFGAVPLAGVRGVLRPVLTW